MLVIKVLVSLLAIAASQFIDFSLHFTYLIFVPQDREMAFDNTTI